jgi:hypothetical protein
VRCVGGVTAEPLSLCCRDVGPSKRASLWRLRSFGSRGSNVGADAAASRRKNQSGRDRPRGGRNRQKLAEKFADERSEMLDITMISICFLCRLRFCFESVEDDLVAQTMLADAGPPTACKNPEIRSSTSQCQIAQTTPDHRLQVGGQGAPCASTSVPYGNSCIERCIGEPVQCASFMGWAHARLARTYRGTRNLSEKSGAGSAGARSRDR